MAGVFHPPASSPLLVGLIGLGGAGLIVFASLLRAPRPLGADVAPDTSARTLLEPHAPSSARTELTPAAAALAPALDDERSAPPPSRRRPGARTEKEFLAAFRALSAAELEARAAEVLDGDGPQPEKVALLRALRACAAPRRVAWHEHAVRTGSDDSGPQGVGLASTALQALLDEAAADPDARAALGRLAFDAPPLAPELRRRAAAGFARRCGEEELARLAADLAQQDDELFIAGVLAAVAERDPSAGRTRLLALHDRTDVPSTLAGP